MGDLYIRAMCQNILGGSSSVEEQAIIEGCARRIIVSGFRVDSSGNITFDGGVTFNGLLTLGNLTITNALIANGNVTLGDAAGDTITVNGTLAADWTFAQITPASAASRLVGRGAAAGAGDFEEITLGAGLTMTGTSLSANASNALLDGTNHTDTTNSAATRGDLIVGTGTPATWDDLPLGAAGKILRSDGTDLLYSTVTIPDTFATGTIPYGSATNVLSALALGTAGKIIRSDGTIPAYSTLTIPDTISDNLLLYATSANVLGTNANLSFDETTLTIPGQVAFPASQLASSGANTLDDYEEGTWTPVIGGTGGQSGQSYATQAGTYAKCGQLVICQFYVELTTEGTITGNVQISGLPFNNQNVNSANQSVALHWEALATNWVSIVGLMSQNGVVVIVRGAAAASGNNNVSLTATDITNTTVFAASVCYRTSA